MEEEDGEAAAADGRWNPSLELCKSLFIRRERSVPEGPEGPSSLRNFLLLSLFFFLDNLFSFPPLQDSDSTIGTDGN